jgi:predicted lipoprotein
MFQKAKLITFTLFVILVSVASCKKDTVGTCGENWIFATQINNEAMALSQAASAYGQDPTPANCQAYKNAFQDYIDAARELENCAREVGQLNEYNAALNEAQASLDNLQC